VDTWRLAVATDISGNVYVAGITFGGLDGNTMTGTSDSFLTKYSTSGTKVYTKQLGATGADTYGEAVETDANGNVVVSGVTSGELDGNNCVGSWNTFATNMIDIPLAISTWTTRLFFIISEIQNILTGQPVSSIAT
jgi:hypothetical protein